MPDDCNYPTDEELARIREWDAFDLPGWFAYIKSVGFYWPDESWGWSEEQVTDDFGRPVRVLHISTGGWSGNEEIFRAMRENHLCWWQTWQVERRGGHFTFHIPNKEAK